ncbi:cyclin 2 [Echinococcus multilocularis]|uniref:Protein CNPPD1 n=1 Tax=Echinococcus multilocularis TaxID=6211 RepID=A0A068YKZ7_ECHMU|nr:cyclin 2 [Echinococcus multilocularis]
MARLVRQGVKAGSSLSFGSFSFQKGGNLLSKTVINLVNSATERQLGKLDIYTFLKFLRCSEVTSTTLITALILVDKFRQLDPKPLLFYEITATELLIVATMAASKFLHDTDTKEASSNGTWAANFDIDLKVLNVMEIRFFSALGWNLFVSQSDFNKFIMSGFAAAVHHGKAVRDKSKRHHPYSIVRKISPAHFDRKSGNLQPRWVLAKAMAVCAAALLALSHQGVSTISDDSHIEPLLSRFLPTSPVITSPHPDPSISHSDQLTVPSIGGFNYTAPKFHSCQTIPNGSSCSPVSKSYLYYDSVNAACTHPIVQNRYFGPTLLAVGVS